MAAPIRRDQLAARFADKLAKAPAKGTRPVRPAAPVEPAPPAAPSEPRLPRPTAPAPKAAAPRQPVTSPRTPASPRRGATGGVVRGHLVPRAVHSSARRAALRARSVRGQRVTWDDVLAEALTLLDLPTALRRLDDVPDSRERAPAMVQARITETQDLAFAELRLDVADATGTTVRFERLWALALLLWIEAQSAS